MQSSNLIKACKGLIASLALPKRGEIVIVFVSSIFGMPLACHYLQPIRSMAFAGYNFLLFLGTC